MNNPEASLKEFFWLKWTKQTKFIAITSQKGEMGKSTLKVIVASYLYYELGYNLTIIDYNANQKYLENA